MELRKQNLLQELQAFRAELLNLNFADATILPYIQVAELLLFKKWDATFKKCDAFTNQMADIPRFIMSHVEGYKLDRDPEVYNELRVEFVCYIDDALRMIDQTHKVRPLLEEYIARVKDTKLSKMLKEFNEAKEVAPNLLAIGFRTILCLVIQERAKRDKPQSKTATRTDLAVRDVLTDARDEHILSKDEQRLIDNFVSSTRKDVYDFVAHRPGADNTVDKSEVDVMVDFLNKLLPSIIN